MSWQVSEKEAETLPGKAGGSCWSLELGEWRNSRVGCRSPGGELRVYAAGRIRMEAGQTAGRGGGMRGPRESPLGPAVGRDLPSEHHQSSGLHLTWAVGSVLRVVLKLRAWHRPPSASTSCWAPGRSWTTDRRSAALVPDRSY